MAANALLEPVVSEHRLERWEKRISGHRTEHTAFCACGWRSLPDLHQHRVEMALGVHVECSNDKAAKQAVRSDLLSLTEEFLVTVAECERAWREEDRIDRAVRYAR